MAGLSLLLFVLTFYHFDPSIETGLDPSYAFGLNYIFAHQIPFGTQVIYTYGPLGFLYFPQDIVNNFFIGVFCVSALRLLFIFLFAKITKEVKLLVNESEFHLSLPLRSAWFLDFGTEGDTTTDDMDPPMLTMSYMV